MTASHTPGPWTINLSVPLKTGIAIMAGNYGIAKVWNSEGGQDAENQANAKLIAEAPNLLKTLCDLTDAVTAKVNETGAGGYLLARLSDARSAISAAKGESP